MVAAQADQLARAHHTAQRALQAQVARDFARLWPNANWPRLEPAWAHWVAAIAALIRANRSRSASMAAGFLTRYRLLEGVAGDFTPAVADAVPDELIEANLVATVRDSLLKATNDALQVPDQPGTQGRILAEGRKNALVRGTGVVTRQVSGGGRDTITNGVTQDRHALGWARLSDGDPCAFCAMLISRGPAYKAHGTARFQAHDHDGCSAVPVYDRADWVGRDEYERYDHLWRTKTGGKSGKGALKAFRQHLDNAA